MEPSVNLFFNAIANKASQLRQSRLISPIAIFPHTSLHRYTWLSKIWAMMSNVRNWPRC